MAVTDHSLTRALQRAVQCFRRARIPYAVIGAWALAVWGRVRATQDVDFMVVVDASRLHALAIRLKAARMALDSRWESHNPLLRDQQLRLHSGAIGIDVLRPRDAHDTAAMRRRRRKLVDGNFYWFIAPEDLILQKLKVGRPRDFEDALSVIQRSGAILDRAYMSRWAAKLRITDELAHILSLDSRR